MTNLLGASAAGVYRLYAVSSLSGTILALTSWSITVSTSCPFPSFSPPQLPTCTGATVQQNTPVNVGPTFVTNYPNFGYLNVTASGYTGVISSMTVVLYGFNTSNATFTQVTLTHLGVSMGLFYLYPTTVPASADITFSDTGMAMPSSNVGIGTYHAAVAQSAEIGSELAVFDGLSPNGLWTVYIEYDGLPSGAAAFTGIRLAFVLDCGTHAAPALTCPTTVSYTVAACAVSISSYSGYFSNNFTGTNTLITYLPATPDTLPLGNTVIEVFSQNYYGTGSCNVTASVATPGNADPCGSHGQCSGLVCSCDSGYQGPFCCQASHNNPANASETCGGQSHGTCAFGGVCDCNTGYGGVVCCPQLNGQATPCGLNGTCNASSLCTCNSGYVGISCNYNENCPTDAPGTECSAQGTCLPVWETKYCLTQGVRFVDNGALYYSVGGTFFPDNGLVAMIQAAITQFSLGNTESIALVNSYYGACTAADRPTCFTQVIGAITSSSIFQAMVGNATLYPTSSCSGHADCGIYTVVTQAVQSFLGISSLNGGYVGDVNSFVTSCTTYCGQSGVTRLECLTGCANTVVGGAQPFENNAATTIYPAGGLPGTLVGNSVYTDEGVALFAEMFINGSTGYNGHNQTWIDQLMALNFTGLTRENQMVLIANTITASHQFQFVIASYGMQTNLYVNDTLSRLFPQVAGSWSTSLLLSMGTSLLAVPTAANQANVIIELMCEQWVLSLNKTQTSIGTFPIYQCSCVTTSVGTFNDTHEVFQLVEGSSDCSTICPQGTDNLPCSGFAYGKLRGICDGDDSGACDCGNGFGGYACQWPTAAYCIQWNASLECTSPQNGKCVIVDESAGTFQCQCSTGWNGTYCQNEYCPTANGTSCNGWGVCSETGSESAPQCNCFVDAFLSVSTTQAISPILPTGAACNVNGIDECGVFVFSGLGSQGFWIECSGHGSCSVVGGVPECVCTTGYYGAQCQFSNCPTIDCPGDGRSICNATTGACVCNTMWNTSSSCTDQTCICGNSLCGFGSPDATGTKCLCDSGWALDAHNLTCTRPVCPLIMRVTYGEVACNFNQPVCLDGQDSLTDKCCIQTCPSCSYNYTTSEFVCACDPAPLFVESDGVCFTYCHGQPYVYNNVSGNVTCNCSAITGLNLIYDGTCLVSTCLNGGYATTDHSECICPSTTSGTLCEIVDCGERGTLNAVTGQCDCVAPFYKPQEPNRLTCLTDVLQSIAESSVFASSANVALFNDPTVSAYDGGQIVDNEGLFAVIRKLAAGWVTDAPLNLTIVTIDAVPAILQPTIDDATPLAITSAILGKYPQPDTILYGDVTVACVDIAWLFSNTALTLACAGGDLGPLVQITRSDCITWFQFEDQGGGALLSQKVSPSVLAYCRSIVTPNGVAVTKESIIGSFCDSNIDIVNNCGIPIVLALGSAKLLAGGSDSGIGCPGIGCLQTIAALTRQTTCQITGKWKDCLYDNGDDSFPNRMFPTPSPYTDKVNYAVNISNTVFLDEGQALLLHDLLDTFAPENLNATTLLDYTLTCDSTDGIDRSSCLVESGLHLLFSELFTDSLDADFAIGSGVVIGGVAYEDAGLAAVHQLLGPLYGTGLTATTAPAFYLGLCEAQSIVGLACKQQSILSTFTCYNRGFCQTTGNCQSCIPKIFNQVNCQSNQTGFLARCLVSDIVIPDPNLGDFFHSAIVDDPAASVTVSGTVFSDEGYVSFVESFISAFDMSTLAANLSLLLQFNQTCDTQATEVILSPLCSADTSNGGIIQFRTGSVPPQFTVICPSHLLYNADNSSCDPLDCDSSDGNVLCAQCCPPLGPYNVVQCGTASVIDNALVCDCTGTGYTGPCCKQISCANGGYSIADPNNEDVDICVCLDGFGGPTCNVITACANGGSAINGVCVCLFPYSGTTCVANICQNGGTPVGNACSCPSGFVGSLCQFSTGLLTSGTGVSSSSSSSSSSGVSVLVTNSGAVLVTTQKLLGAIGGVAAAIAVSIPIWAGCSRLLRPVGV